MNKEMIEFYTNKLARKEKLLTKLQQKENDFEYEMAPNETIQLNVLQAEIRLIKEVIEDFSAC